MNDQDIIRKAVELADGWTLDGDYIETLEGYRSTIHAPDEIRDALAAQLVRQVDALSDFSVEILWDRTYVMRWPDNPMYKLNTVSREKGDDRNMNTLRAIVESKVLENESND